VLIDALSAALRAASFIAMLQAGGAVLFLVLLVRDADGARQATVRLARIAALAAIVLLLAQYALEPARMAGSLSGMWDVELQDFVLHTRTAAALALRLAGLAIVLVALRHGGTAMRGTGVTGAALIAVSFAATGHTSESALRWLLAPLLVMHVLIVEFWFGSLLPLLQVGRHATAAVAARIVQRFTRLATWTVPLILVAGVLVAVALLPDAKALRAPYGAGLLLKVLAFAVLMVLAALNKWRLGPALEYGGTAAIARLGRSIGIEYLLIAAVLAGTAVLTTFWSPHD
jgi:putative copper resistance protein D